jgi:hypothetical protein
MKMRALFIGNSLTYFNQFPDMVALLAEAKKHQLECAMCAQPGYRLKQHASEKATLAKIKEGNWDFVILQEQGQIPAYIEAKLQRESSPYVKELCAAIRAASSDARIVFYETAARRNGEPENLSVPPELRSYEGMQKRIGQGYELLAKANKGSVAPVGRAWAKVRKEHPEIDLYADDSHPNPTGTYLAACVFFSVFFNESPVGLPHPSSIEDQTAGCLLSAVTSICR